MILDSINGSLYIDGTIFENLDTLTPTEASTDFVIEDTDGNVVLFINETGYIFMKGTLTENGDP